MKKQKLLGIGFFSFDIGRSMLDVHLYKFIIVKILNFDSWIPFRTVSGIANRL